MTNNEQALYHAVTHLGDNALILGHRISEWCGHGPVLEQDIAMTNIALDVIGQARMYLEYAGKLSGENRSDDDMAYKRDVLDYKNFLITELPNGDFADTIARQYCFDQWHFLFLNELQHSKDETLSAIAQKSLKEVTYHRRWSSEWVVRLGDGTEESKEKMQRAIDDVWMYTGEMFTQTDEEKALVNEGILPDASKLLSVWTDELKRVLNEATLDLPTDEWMQEGGKNGVHTEYLGFILAEMQYLPRAYPDATW
jgi:ring-1,2-phenylacetyl-CoA epoxidase subunit PaaC